MRKKLYIFKHFAKSKKLFFWQYLSFSVWFPLSLKHWSPLVSSEYQAFCYPIENFEFKCFCKPGVPAFSERLIATPMTMNSQVVAPIMPSCRWGTSNGNASETKANESFDNGVFFDIEAKRTPSIVSKLFSKRNEHIR